MKNILKIFLAGFFCWISFPQLGFAQGPDSPVQTSKTLKYFFVEAQENSERIAISEETVREAEALYRQTLGESLPEFLYRRSASKEDREDFSQEGALRVTKTGFTGYRELAAIRSGRSVVGQRKYELRRVEQLLLQDISLAFYSILLAEENVMTTNKLIDLADARLNELLERVRIGRTREADSLGQEVLKTSLESQLEESLRQVHSRRDLLAFLIGASELEGNIVDVPVLVEERSLETFLAQAPNRPDVEAAQASVKSFKSLLHATRADYFPSLTATANSYTDRSNSSDDVDFDVLLSVDVPIWNWGGRQGAVGAANAVLKQEEQELQLALRQAELEIRDAYRDYQTARRQMELHQSTLDLARRDYEFQVRDDAQGLVTSLDVFASLDRLNNAELTFNNARLEEKLAAINLQLAAGASPEEILK